MTGLDELIGRRQRIADELNEMAKSAQDSETAMGFNQGLLVHLGRLAFRHCRTIRAALTAADRADAHAAEIETLRQECRSAYEEINRLRSPAQPEG